MKLEDQFPVRVAMLFLGVASLASVARAQRSEGPTVEEAQQALEAGDYVTALETSTRVLAREDNQLADAERHELLMIRAKAMTGRRVWEHAERTFDQAAQVAPTPEDRAAAMASAALLRRAQGGTLTVGDGQKFDLSDLRSHGAAAAASLDHELDQITPKVEQAQNAPNLVPIMDLMPQITDLYALEVATTGKSDKTDPMFQALGERAQELMNNELKVVGRRINSVRDNANNLVTTNGYTNPAGLNTRQRERLQEDVVYLTRIKDTARRGQDMSEAMDLSGQKWNEIILATNEWIDTAASMLDQGY